MFRDGGLPIPEPLTVQSIRSFIEDVEADIRLRETHTGELLRYRTYFEALGGRVVSSLPIPDVTCGIAKIYSPLNKMALMQPIDPRRPIRHAVIRQYPLSDMLAQNPAFPDFWRSVAIGDFVPYASYEQSAIEKQKKDRVITIGENGDISFPDCLVEVTDDFIIRIYFLPPIRIQLLYPHCMAKDTFFFDKVPREIDRAFRVYNNACVTRGIPLFWDADPSHVIYKHVLSNKRIAIEYKMDQPNRMRPVLVDI